MKKHTFSVLGTNIGAILGLPLSYYFQSGIIKMKVGGIFGYIENFRGILESRNLVVNIIISVIVCAIVGGVIGNYIDKNAKAKTD